MQLKQALKHTPIRHGEDKSHTIVFYFYDLYSVRFVYFGLSDKNRHRAMETKARIHLNIVFYYYDFYFVLFVYLGLSDKNRLGAMETKVQVHYATQYLCRESKTNSAPSRDA